jgi:hypothetical protein
MTFAGTSAGTFLTILGHCAIMTATRLLVLPLDQFAFAEFTNDEKEQLLHLSFASHEVMVRGRALRRIETALHKLELSFLMALPAKYHSLVPDGQPKIREIVVTEM